jgi:hypothetical protein
VSCALDVRFYYYHLVDTSAGGVLVPVCIIRPVVCVPALMCVMSTLVDAEVYSKQLHSIKSDHYLHRPMGIHELLLF